MWLALRESDCSVAMQSGSDAARCVSQLVLLDSDFSSMPLAVQEGRRCINNIQRSAALFLVKTIFSFLLAFMFMFAASAYPFQPIQLTLISALFTERRRFCWRLSRTTTACREASLRM